jgi:hypothetical protein
MMNIHQLLSCRLCILFAIFVLQLATIESSSRALPPSFLSSTYAVTENEQQFASNNFKHKEFYIRNVPGDGSCLFHAISVCLRHKLLRTHGDFDTTCRELSRRLRSLACDVMCGCLGIDTLFVIEDGVPLITFVELQDLMSEKYNQSFQDYVSNMRHNLSAWGGGPEIIAISNYLQCPIHVYELCSSKNDKEFRLTPKALFGSPNFDHRFIPADAKFYCKYLLF